tara:strand:+ start:29 stop:727 length:699 start_codon:yes stop_codon:yes gene_type:complete
MHPLREYTVPCLIIGEMPTLVFTLLDKYRLLSYYKDSDRVYATTTDLQQVIYVYIRNVIGILLAAALGMEILIHGNIVPYDMSNDMTIDQYLVQFIQVTLTTEFLFYWLHRYVHNYRKLYYWMHASHHKWRDNSFALVNHDLEKSEISTFALCPAIPCMLFGVNWRVMLFHSIYTNWQGTYSHSGYHIPMLDMLLLTDSRDHDYHHKKPTYNFAGGGWYSLMDRIFGTYYYF